MNLFRAMDHVFLTRGYREVLHGLHGDLEPYAEIPTGGIGVNECINKRGQVVKEPYHYQDGVIVKAKNRQTGEHVEVVLKGDRYCW